MAKNFNELRKKMSPEERERNVAGANRMLLKLTLRELRQKVSELNQEDVARSGRSFPIIKRSKSTSSVRLKR